MKVIRRFKKTLACFFLFLMGAEMMVPNAAYALTSGPVQPEMKGFEPAGTSDMVDLFTGDFTYNIPLLDVGGYPINISYHSGSGMDDEASWVGLGWSLNPGVMSRQVRGLPDDFNGDVVMKEFNMRGDTTYGVNTSVKAEVIGIPGLKGNVGVKVGIYKNNYRGIGAEFGINPGINAGFGSGGSLTANLNLNANSQSGVDISPRVTVGMMQDNIASMEADASLSVGLSYNSRSGLKGMTLSDSWGIKQKISSRASLGTGGGFSSFIDFASEPVSPSIKMPWSSASFSLSVDVGGAFSLLYFGGGLEGHHSTRNLATKMREMKAYGFMHAEHGKDDQEALMDFNREKDQPFYPTSPYLAVPVITNDLFVASSQEGTRQFRPYKGSTGIFFDSHTQNSNNVSSVGIELGFGPGAFQAGGDYYRQEIREESGKWEENNQYRNVGDFKGYDSVAPVYESYYFKQTGEKTQAAEAFDNALGSTEPVAVNVQTIPDNAVTTRELVAPHSKKTAANMHRAKRDKRNNLMQGLNAMEALSGSLDKQIQHYPLNQLVLKNCAGGYPQQISRLAHAGRRHHLSELTVTAEDGKRMIYGIPVYNRVQREVSFSVDARQSANTANLVTGLVAYDTAKDNTILNRRGKDWYFNRESMPAYAHSYLLTAILSPDYRDVTGDGITEDDLGTAVKFNYTRYHRNYRWRTPYEKGKANYNENHISDPEDDKANYVYGEKEIWYLHSIESKTMMAQFILNTARRDALGVLSENGGPDPACKMAALKEIRLYSKSDIRLNGSNAVPVKTIHFRYSYKLCRELPNSRDNAGKLTLDSLYTTYGTNTRGQLNPYVFGYDTTATNTYGLRQFDRWGTYKNRASNPHGLSNSEYPYSLRDTAAANRNASLWQINSIRLPTGGEIKVKYESDDYAYVQDKRAMQMCAIKGIGAIGDSIDIHEKDKLFVELPVPVANEAELRKRYFEGIKKLFIKFNVDLDNKYHYEYVPGYVDISDASISLVNSGMAQITLPKYNGKYNPIAKMAWQMLRLDLPKYAYPFYDNSSSGSSDAATAIRSLIGAIGMVKELWQSFDETAVRKKFGNRVRLSRSMVRLNNPDYKKTGGGCRVKEVRMYDNWPGMTDVSDATLAYYGQEYDYTTTEIMADGSEAVVSSGVASYEPMIGNDENPFRQPVDYAQRIPLGLTNYFFMEEPICESYFPNPQVGYSKVTIRQLEQGEEYTRAGSSVSEFYTARDFPTIVSQVKLPVKRFGTRNILGLLKVRLNNSMAASQGYCVRVNDMHGKPKVTADYDKAGQMISSVRYQYRTENPDAPVKKLRNNVRLLQPDNTVAEGIIGRDIEMFTDMRQELTSNSNISARLSFGAQVYIFFALGFVFPGIGPNEDIKMFRSTSSIKLIQETGILEKVIKMQDGSTISTENVLWDSETGDVLLTKVQNEFGDPVYNLSYPAHWAYDGMGPAYKNAGILFSGFTSNVYGIITTPGNPRDYFAAGDELMNIRTGKRAWIIEGPEVINRMRVIDETGNHVEIRNSEMMVLRSGRRNMAGAGVGMIASLQDPVKNGKLDISVATKILNSRFTTYKDEWPVLIRHVMGYEYEYAGCFNSDCIMSFMDACILGKYAGSKKFLFSSKYNAATVSSIMDPFEEDSSCFNSGAGTRDQFPYYLYNVRTAFSWSSLKRNYFIQPGDSAQFGDAKIYFDEVSPEFNVFVNRTDLTIDSLQSIILTRVSSNPSFCTYKLCKYVQPPDPDPDPDPDPEPCITCRTHEGENDSCSTTYLTFRIWSPRLTNKICVDPLNKVFNPYLFGLKGNWRPEGEWAYHAGRVAIPGPVALKGSTDIRRSGYFDQYTAFRFAQSIQDANWVKATEISLYGAKGEELENKDAIGQYSAIQYGYSSSLPIYVASNAMHRQIGYAGFEDNYFGLNCLYDYCSPKDHFSFRSALNSAVTLDANVAHTGKYSLAVNAGNTATVQWDAYVDSGALYYFANVRYILGRNDLAGGISPTPGKYVLSAWVKDDNKSSRTTDAQIEVNGNTLVNSAVAWPMVEGWKRVEVVFTIPVKGDFSVKLISGGNKTWFDDVRIHPFNSQAKSFVYDARTQLLMAELDENNFATFYEYDDEHTLIRVKKETERGIMTIKETRSWYQIQ